MAVTKKQFNATYKKWERAIQDPRIQLSSRPQDYTDIEAYQGIVKLGKEALPFILEKIEKGVFLMNQAALQLSGVDVEKLVEEETKQPVRKRVRFLAQRKKPAFLSEQQKSELILKNLR